MAVGFADVPVDVQLKIFGYLDATTLCRAAIVCSDWYQLTADDIIWRDMMEQNAKVWSVTDYVMLPDLYAKSECMSNKEIYLRCCPHLSKRRDSESKFQALRVLVATTLRTLLWRQTPFVALCGPGLESATGGIVRKLLYDQNDVFTKVGMFPGRYHGAGSGFTLKLGSRTFNLSTLYSTNKKERNSLAPQERLRRSRMLMHRSGAAAERQQREEARDHEDDSYELADEIKALCAALHAVVYVVESTATQPSEGCESNTKDMLIQHRAEILAIDAALPPNCPLAVISCTPASTDKRLPCIDVARTLKLSALSRPWRVNNCSADRITEDIKDPIGWMLDTVRQHS